MDKRKPIYLIVTPFFPTPEKWQGPFCFDFARALERLNKYDVRVFVSSDTACEPYEYHGVQVRRFRYRRLPGALAPFLFERGNRRRFLAEVAKAGIDWNDVAVYHAHDVIFIPYVRFEKKHHPTIKTVLHFHAMGHPFHLACGRFGVLQIYSLFHYQWFRKWLEMVDLPVFVSKRQQSMFGKWYPNGFLKTPIDIRKGIWFGNMLRPIQLQPSIVLYNGFDYSVFKPAKSTRKNDDLVIGDVANVCDTKDQMTLLRAVNRLRNEPSLAGHFKCRLVGSGEMLQACRDYVKANELEGIVEFITEMDHLKLPEFYRSLDLFVSPSWAEGFCCTFVEAHGCGVPIMGCTGVSVDEVFSQEEQKKWLFPPQDDKRLSEMILDFYHNRPAQVFVDDFDIDKLVPAYVKKLEALT